MKLPEDFDYDTAIRVRDAWQKMLDSRYDEAFQLQDQINDIQEQIDQYNREQRALDE